MVAGKTEGTMKIERVGRTSVADLLDRVGLLLRWIAPGFLGLYVWTIVVEGGGDNITWVTVVGAGICGSLVYALHTCFLSRLVLRPIITQVQLGKDDHPWISSDQRKLAEHGIGRLLQELSVQRRRRRISDNAEAKTVQRDLDRRCALGSLLYCAGYVVLCVAGLAISQAIESVRPSELVAYVIFGGILLLVVAFVCDYVTVKNDLWAAATHPHGKTPKVAPPKPKPVTQQVRAATPKLKVAKKVKAKKSKAKKSRAKATRSKKKSSR